MEAGHLLRRHPSEQELRQLLPDAGVHAPRALEAVSSELKTRMQGSPASISRRRAGALQGTVGPDEAGLERFKKEGLL
jgi:hypothetical protein